MSLLKMKPHLLRRLPDALGNTINLTMFDLTTDNKPIVRELPRSGNMLSIEDQEMFLKESSAAPANPMRKPGYIPGQPNGVMDHDKLSKLYDTKKLLAGDLHIDKSVDIKSRINYSKLAGETKPVITIA